MAQKPQGGGDGVIGLCLMLAAGVNILRLDLPDGRFGLRWIHSIEQVEWQEDWRADGTGLSLTLARIKGSGAGMEPPDGASLRDGWYEWRPGVAPLPRLILGRSDAVADHVLCIGGDCRPLWAYIAGSDPVIMEPCHAP
jgi:hypothetical protein